MGETLLVIASSDEVSQEPFIFVVNHLSIPFNNKEKTILNKTTLLSRGNNCYFDKLTESSVVKIKIKSDNHYVYFHNGNVDSKLYSINASLEDVLSDIGVDIESDDVSDIVDTAE